MSDTRPDNVVVLDEHRPHRACRMRHRHCGREWVAVWPDGVDLLECPGCGMMIHVLELEVPMDLNHIGTQGCAVALCGFEGPNVWDGAVSLPENPAYLDDPALWCPRCVVEMRRQAQPRDIFGICAALHSYYTGSGADDYAEWNFGELGRQADIAYLRQRLAEWTPSHARWAAYDDAVKALVIATLAEQGR